MSFQQQWVVYDETKQKLFKKLLDLNGGDTLKVALFLSTSNCANAELVSAVYSTLTHELAGGSGYTTGGAAAASPTVAFYIGFTTFDTDDVLITASGGSLTARWAVMYDVTTGDLLAYGPLALDASGHPTDIVVPDGTTLKINITDVIELVG